MANQESKTKEMDTSGQHQPSISAFSTSKKGFRRATTDGEVSTINLVSSPGTSCDPVPSGSSTVSAATSTTAALASTPRVMSSRFPVRVGITWQKGERLEAMDFSRTWYPSKIVEIDEEAKHVLIHFEGWNQRYDEWVPMESDKLRAVTRHSERKDKGVRRRRIHPHPIYRAGEKVLAKWTDCKKYPAKISRLMEDGMYEVIFYDGVTRHIQPINIQPMPEEMKDLKTVPVEVPPVPKTKLSFKEIRVSLPENMKRVKEKIDKNLARRDKNISNRNRVRVPDKNKQSIDDDGKTFNRIAKCGVVLDRIRLSSRGRVLNKNFYPKTSVTSSRRGRPVSRGNKKVPYSWRIPTFKKLPVQPSGNEDAVPYQVEMTETSSAAPRTPTIAVVTGSSSALSASSSTAAAATVPVVTLATARKSLEVKEVDVSAALLQPKAAAAEVEAPQRVETVAVHHPLFSQSESHAAVSKRTKKRSNTVPHVHIKQKKIQSSSKDDGVKSAGLTKRPPKLGQLDRSRSLDMATVVAGPVTGITLPAPVFVPSKAFIVEEDHNPFKCPHEGCNKAFRKENLLTYHIKYYHTQAESALTLGGETAAEVTSPLLQLSGVRRRRKKTSSICSTDSDVSVTSKGKTSCKRYREPDFSSLAAASIPDTLSRDLWTDVKHSHTSHDSAPEELPAVDTEDEDMEADVVNCVCGLRETSGLMIQCDVCMCWQHFVCVDTDNSGVPPTNYVCRLCENTPGIRDSCRYIYDMSWERRGELPTFPFTSGSSVEHLRTIACECNEMISAILAIKAALHSTRRQIKISKEDADPEFQLWQTDWDNWTKPEEDLTLTPRSGDPDPSPTPSTFLFSTAPRSEITSAITEVCSPSISVSSFDPLLQSTMLPVATATVEITSGLGSPPVGSTYTDNLSPASSNPAPPLPLPTPSTGNGNALAPLQGHSDHLVRDLFSGCHDNDLQSTSTGIFQGIENHTQNSMQIMATERQSSVDNQVTAKCDSNVADEMLSQLDNSEQLPKPAPSHSQLGSKRPYFDDPTVCNGLSLDVKANAENMNTETVSSGSVILGQTGEERHNQLSTTLSTGSDGRDQLSLPSLTATDSLSRTSEAYDSKHLTSLYVDHLVDGHVDADDDDDVPDNDTDTAEESLDPYRNCEQNLLIHVSRVHADIEKQLELLEQQVADLEASEHTNPTVHLTEENVLIDVPALKKSLSKLYRNLVTVEKLCVHH